jgi:hypothetical protein
MTKNKTGYNHMPDMSVHHKLEILDSFEEYLTKGGDILSFPDYYRISNYVVDTELQNDPIIIALCEEYAIAGDYTKIFQLLYILFHYEKWSLKRYRRFIACIEKSELLSPLAGGIRRLFEKNLFK